MTSNIVDVPSLEPYDAILLVSFGGPEKPDEVVDFLEVVTAGSGIPRSRLATVGEHYFLFGGKSPINDQNKALMAALTDELTARGVRVPIYWGNRNWHPFITEAVQELKAAEHRRVLMLTTSAYPSYAGCRSYREAVAGALAEQGDGLQVDRIGNYGLDEGFVAANAQALRAALTELPGARVVFVTHSIPTAMDQESGNDVLGRGAYTSWHREVAQRVFDAQQLGDQDFDLVYCSRSGRPGQPWVEPDVNDHLAELRARGIDRVVLAPIGFISDHMEVVYDLDTQARETCRELGIQLVRSATAGVAPAFVAALADRLLERAAQARRGSDGGRLGCDRGCGGEGCCPNAKDPDTPAIA
ncbi:MULTISPECIES: ferrochelatase [unclassified Luteococcus]|uniref:ferrochelatase n=1 Tax=unclassified Luteococcus TaxID=2639923 RepID=UPI00313CF347